MQTTKTMTASSKKRMARAKKTLRELTEKIAPYLKPRKYKSLSTRGRWRNSTIPGRISATVTRQRRSFRDRTELRYKGP